MHKKLFLLPLFFLAACISVSVEAPPTAAPSGFVTSTLPPTQEVYIPLTLTPTLEVTLTPTISVTIPADCKNGATLLRDVTIPDDTKIQSGTSFTKTWEFINNGTCPWVNYALKFAAGDQMNAPLSAPIPLTMPREKVEISVDLTAPAMNGKYTGYFTLNTPEGQDVPIGVEKTFWVRILVEDGELTAPMENGAARTASPATSNSGCDYSANESYVQDLIARIQQARKESKLKALTVNPLLSAAAQSHSADMACNNFHGHTGSDGSWINDRLIRAGYSPSHYVEIVAIGTPENAMAQWGADKIHWDAILDARATEIGVGYAYYAKSDFGGYMTVNFASP